MSEREDPDRPQLGDRWVGEGDDGSPIYMTVTEVIPPPLPGDDWIIRLDGDRSAHIGWWWGQGWQQAD